MLFVYRVLAAGFSALVCLGSPVAEAQENAIESTKQVASAMTRVNSDLPTNTQSRPVRVQFRDLFKGLNPSDRAIELSGAEIEIVGYLTPPQAFPFRVLVGQPSETCPYCEPPQNADDDILPFLLIFTDLGGRDFSFRSRLRVTGILQARQGAFGPDGRKLEMRLVDAIVAPDSRYIDPRSKKSSKQKNITENSSAANVVAPFN